MKTMQKDPEKLGHKPLFRVFHVGATDLIRTGDLLITRVQLIYMFLTQKRYFTNRLRHFCATDLENPAVSTSFSGRNPAG